MKPIWAATRLYLLGSFRQQVHLCTLFLGALLFLLPAYVNAFSLGMDAFVKVTTDFGLTVIGYFLLALGILLGATWLPEEIENRRLYPLLARSISRTGILVAQLLALLLVLAGSGLLLGTCLALSLAALTREFDFWLFQGVLGSFLQAGIISSLCLACSVRMGSAVSAVIGIVVFVTGSMSGDLFSLLLGSTGEVLSFAKALIPDLSALAFKDSAVGKLPLGLGQVTILLAYSAGWTALFLHIAKLQFEEIDL